VARFRQRAYIEQEKNICRVLVGRPQGKRPLGRHGLGRRIVLKCI
jgi:hypothetical protein